MFCSLGEVKITPNYNKVIGTRNQIIFLLKSAFESFGEKLMRVSKGRPIGASAADKVVNKE